MAGSSRFRGGNDRRDRRAFGDGNDRRDRRALGRGEPRPRRHPKRVRHARGGRRGRKHLDGVHGRAPGVRVLDPGLHEDRKGGEFLGEDPPHLRGEGVGPDLRRRREYSGWRDRGGAAAYDADAPRSAIAQVHRRAVGKRGGDPLLAPRQHQHRCGGGSDNERRSHRAVAALAGDPIPGIHGRAPIGRNGLRPEAGSRRILAPPGTRGTAPNCRNARPHQLRS